MTIAPRLAHGTIRCFRGQARRSNTGAAVPSAVPSAVRGTAVPRGGPSCTDGELSDTTSFSLRVQDPPATGSNITVFTAGKSGEETIELEIDGEVEAVFTNVGGDFATVRGSPSPTSVPFRSWPSRSASC